MTMHAAPALYSSPLVSTAALQAALAYQQQHGHGLAAQQICAELRRRAQRLAALNSPPSGGSGTTLIDMHGGEVSVPVPDNFAALVEQAALQV